MRNSPLNQVDVERELLRLVDMLEQETEAFEQLSINEAEKSARYKHSWATEYISAKGSIPEREAWADYKLDSECYDAKMAEALMKAKREKLFMLRTSIEALRTISANVRTLT
jgi:hypothetical protein